MQMKSILFKHLNQEQKKEHLMQKKTSPLLKGHCLKGR